MKARHAVVLGTILVVLGLLAWAIKQFAIEPVVLQPHGSIAIEQRDLLIMSTLIMLAVIIPVFILLGIVSWKYRATNKKAAYRPTWSKNNQLEIVWWGIPIIIVGILSVIVWQTSHSLDPFTPLANNKRPLKIQVVALQWKWLFMYPEQSAASVNELYIPVDTPVEFSIASDAPMNSFWIPELGGQIYAMDGMSTKLHLNATKTGDYRGVSSNISGEGFADMVFTVHAVDANNFTSTISNKSADKDGLTLTSYESLAEPSVINEPRWYKLVDTSLYQSVIDKYALPHSTDPEYTETMNHGGMH